MNRFVLVHFVDRKYSPGYSFNTGEWPLHVTLVINFSVETNAHDLGHMIETVAARHPVFKVKGEESKVLGSTPVVTVTKSPQIMALHSDLLTLLEEAGAIFDAPEYMWENYIPHATIQKRDRIVAGQEITVDSISLVDLKPHHTTAQKMVLATYQLPPT